MNIYKIIGAIGLLVISFGIINKERRTQDILYIVGGICLEIYSLYLNDIIFQYYLHPDDQQYYPGRDFADLKPEDCTSGKEKLYEQIFIKEH